MRDSGRGGFPRFSDDLPPENWSKWRVSPPAKLPQVGDGGRDAEKPFFRRADHRDFEGCRGWREGRRSLPEARNQRADSLPLEGEVRRYGGRRSPAVKAARG